MALRQGLEQLDLKDGQNLHFEYRWGAGDVNKIRSYAGELVALAPDVILAYHTPTVRSSPAANTHNSNRVSIGVRSRQRWICHEPFEARRQYYGVQHLRTEHGGEMAPVSLKPLLLMWCELPRSLTQRQPAHSSVFFPSLESFAPSLGVTIVSAPVRDPNEIRALFSSPRPANEAIRPRHHTKLIGSPSSQNANTISGAASSARHLRTSSFRTKRGPADLRN